MPRSDTSFRENVLLHYLQLFCYFCTFNTYILMLLPWKNLTKHFLQFVNTVLS